MLLVLLQSESLSSKRAKLHTVAASNNRDHAPQSLYHCLFVPHGCCSSGTSCSWWITHSKQRQLRGCNSARARYRPTIALCCSLCIYSVAPTVLYYTVPRFFPTLKVLLYITMTQFVHITMTQKDVCKFIAQFIESQVGLCSH